MAPTAASKEPSMSSCGAVTDDCHRCSDTWSFTRVVCGSATIEVSIMWHWAGSSLMDCEWRGSDPDEMASWFVTG
jgi:hypothetical protein